MNALEQRLEQLETKAAFQEDTVNQLNAIVIEQQHTIEQLKLVINALQTAVKTHEVHIMSPDSIQDETPPHY